jgi:hypothetical protein
MRFQKDLLLFKDNLAVRKFMRSMRRKAYYNLFVGCIVFVSSIIDIREDIYKIRKEHFLLIIGLVMIVNSIINLTEAYATLRRFAKEVRDRSHPVDVT